MTNAPLFQNSDEQERAYAPQEVPEAGMQAEVGADEGAEGSNRGTAAGAGVDNDEDGGLPVPGLGAGAVSPIRDDDRS